jgi:MFS transporter, PAT family, beta-lactamase induction signal transducer AmpG
VAGADGAAASIGLAGEMRLLAGQPLWIAALALVFGGLLWPALGPLAKVAQWSAVSAWTSLWWMKGLVPVGLMMLGAAAMVVAARRPRAQALRQGPAFGAWVELLTRPGIVAILLFILLFKLGDAAMGFMVKPFWVDAGFSSEQIGLVSVNLGLALSIAGGLIGGWYVDTRGIYRGLWVLGIWQALSNLGYAAAAWAVPAAAAGAPHGWDLPLAWQAAVYTASALESFTGGLGTGAFLAFLMAITSRERATTEYAILSSIFAFTRAVAGFGGGIGAQEMGYAAYFFLTFWMSFPAYLLLPSVRRMLDAAEQR